MTRNTRVIAWIKAARKEFEAFPVGAKDELLDALSAMPKVNDPKLPSL